MNVNTFMFIYIQYKLTKLSFASNFDTATDFFLYNSRMELILSRMLMDI